jgi:hypothetical protein
MWQLMANSFPPPSANPFTAAITGFGQFSMARNTMCPSALNLVPCSTLKSANSAMSAPAANAFLPLPVRITPLTSPLS